MSSRKEFLTAAAAVPLLAAAPPSPAPTAVPSASPPPSKRKISPLARDFAQRMREFDPSLSGKQVEDIAAGIDGNLKTGKYVNPKGQALKNWDEPATTFAVPGHGEGSNHG